MGCNEYTAGDYYVMVDSFPSPECLTTYAVGVEACDEPGENPLDWTEGYADADIDWWYEVTGLTSGATYYVWWDDSYSGSGTYTGDIYAYAYRENQTTTYFGPVDSGYSTSQSVTIAAGQTSMWLMVTPYSDISSNNGTFAVAVTSSDIQP